MMPPRFSMLVRVGILFPALVLVFTPSIVAVQDVDNLEKYTACKFEEKITIEESAERAQPFLRPVETQSGQKTVEIVHGFSLHIAYLGTPFVNFKAERLGTVNYDRDKQTLIESLAHTAANTADMESNQPQRTRSNGFDVYGINRKELTGGVLSIYLLARDIDRTVVTLYLLNTPPEQPKFRTVAEYHKLRDEFLDSYTGCVNRTLAR